MRKIVLSGVLAALLGAGAASAAVVPTTVTATGSYNGNIAVLNDGVVPTDFSSYNAPDKVYYNGTQTPVFRFDFGGLYSVSQLLINADNNDNYQVRLFNSDTLTQTVNILASEGSVGFGVENFFRNFAPVNASYAVVSMSGGDNAYGLGEVRFSGSAVNAVPEPAIWAMMLGGFGLLGAASRRRRFTSIVSA